MSNLVVQFDTVERFDVTFGLELFNSSITKLNANVVDHAGCVCLNKAKITGPAPLVGYLVFSPRIVTSLLSCLGL